MTNTPTSLRWHVQTSSEVRGRKDRILSSDSKRLCTVFEWLPGGWHWRSYDGRDTLVAGEAPTTLRGAKLAAMKWAKEHTRTWWTTNRRRTDG